MIRQVEYDWVDDIEKFKHKWVLYEMGRWGVEYRTLEDLIEQKDIPVVCLEIKDADWYLIFGAVMGIASLGMGASYWEFCRAWFGRHSLTCTKFVQAVLGYKLDTPVLTPDELIHYLTFSRKYVILE